MLLGPKNNLIVNYIPSSMGDEDLRSLFEAIGPLKRWVPCIDLQPSLALPWNQRTGLCDSHYLLSFAVVAGDAHVNNDSCRIMVDKWTGLGLGYGFVEFSQAEHAEAALRQLNGFK
jgi:RNA recognition motif-containing protein